VGQGREGCRAARTNRINTSACERYTSTLHKLYHNTPAVVVGFGMIDCHNLPPPLLEETSLPTYASGIARQKER